MASITKGWATSFIYKQDLTSYYMNSVVRSVIRPGIYNANISVGKSSEAPNMGIIPSSQTLQDYYLLSIKKGTTFVFSNDYFTDPTIGIRRNFYHYDESESKLSGEETSCILKSVALSDFTVSLGDLSEYNGLYAIYACMRYDPLATDIYNITAPAFIILKIESGVPFTSLISGNSVLHPAELNSRDITLDDNFILDGLKSLDNTDYLKYNYYLNLGFLKINNGELGTFTGRGLPEYRYPLSLGESTLLPEIIPNLTASSGDADLKKLYFDIPKSFIGTTIMESPAPSSPIAEGEDNPEYVNWEVGYFSGRQSSSESSDNKIVFDAGDNGVFAVYGTASVLGNKNSIESNLKISYGKRALPGITLNSYESDFTYLDVSPFNINALLGSIKNKDIWSYVIDSIRQDSHSDPNEITDIIPIALVTVENGVINHAKTLCYFGLQERMSKINTLNVKEHNVFNVIPVMA